MMRAIRLWHSCVAVLVLSILLLPCSVSGAPEELSKLQQRYEGQKALLMVDVDVLDGKYLAALERLMETETGNGNLKAVLEIREEIKSHGERESYDPTEFTENLSALESLQKMKVTYRDTRARIEEEKKVEALALKGLFIDQLGNLAVDLTKAGRIEDALAVTKEKERLESTLAVPESGGEGEMGEADPVRARAFCTAKATAELFLNGEPLHLRLSNPEDDGGTDGKSPFFEVREGDFVVVKVRGHAVYRSLALAFELPDEDRVLFFQSKDFKVVGQGADVDPREVTRETIETGPSIHPLPTVPDPYWVETWENHRLDGGGFLKPEPQGEWNVWGAILTKEMLEREGE